MRKLKLQVQVSIDGFIAGPKGEMDWITWSLDDDILKYISDLNKDIGCMLLGRNLAEGFIPHWKVEATDPEKKRKFVESMSNSYDFAMKMYQTPKVVFSKSPGKAEWENTVVAHGNIADEVSQLKNQSGDDIIAYGGAQFVSSLIKSGLIDEFHLFVNPTAIGKGMPIFGGLDGKLDLMLKKSTSFQCGIVVLHYVAKR